MKKYSIKLLSAVIIFAIGIVNLFVFSVFTYERLKQYIESKYIEKSSLLLLQSSHHLNEKMKTAENLIVCLAELDELKRVNIAIENKRLLFSKYLKIMPGIKRIIYSDRNGSVITSSDSESIKDYNPLQEEWYKRAVTKRKEAVWTEPFFDYVDQQIVFSVSSSSLSPDSRISGVFAAVFGVSELSGLLKSDELGHRGYMILLSNNGKVIANRDDYFIGEDIFKGRLKTINFGETISSFNFDLNNIPYIITARRLPANGMFLATAVCVDEIKAALLNEYTVILLSEFFILIFFASLTYALTRKGIDPLNKLSSLMSEAENGNYSVRADYNQYKEIGTLSSQFNSMLEGIQNRDEILKHREVKIQNLAFYDSLTGLPNRAYILKSIKDVMRAHEESLAENKAIGGAILYIDLDGFKIINDSMGHATGDGVLVEVASRLKHNLRYKQTAARIGGDEFVVLLQEIDSIDVIRKVSGRIIELLNRPIFIDDVKYEIGASIGIVLYPVHGAGADVLLKKADIAMYKAKRNGKNNYQVFEENLEEEIHRRNIVEREVRRSVKEKLFFLEYQPLLSFKNDNICGFEALLRNRNENLAIYSISEIIAIAEEIGLIVNVEKHVFREGFIFIRKLNEIFGTNLRLSVNTSSTHIKQLEFIDTIINEVNESGVDISLIDIEITETMMMDSVKDSTIKLKRLRDMGMGIHMDDFGTGYSSLSNLQNLPINCVKIDRSFIESMEYDNKKRNIIELIIAIAHNLDLIVVAEGIETEKQYNYLRSFNCDIAQGFFLHKSLSEEDVHKLIGECFAVV